MSDQLLANVMLARLSGFLKTYLKTYLKTARQQHAPTQTKKRKSRTQNTSHQTALRAQGILTSKK